MPVKLSLIESRFDTEPKTTQLADMAEMAAWFEALAERTIPSKQANQLVCPAVYDGHGRKKANLVETASQWWFDFDASATTPEEVLAHFEGAELIIYRTSSLNSFRMVLSADRAMTIAEYEHLAKVWQDAFLELNPDCGFDPASCVAGQPFYLPANGRTIIYQPGKTINVEGLLEDNPIPHPKPIAPLAASNRPQRVKEDWIIDVRNKVLNIKSGLYHSIYNLCIEMLNACGKDKARAMAEMEVAIRQRGSKVNKHIANAKGIIADLH